MLKYCIKKNELFHFGQNYTLERFSEAGSALIRSAVKFPFDMDVRIFSQLSQKYFFDRSKGGKSKFWKFSTFYVISGDFYLIFYWFSIENQ